MTAVEHITLTNINTHLGNTFETYHYATQTGCNIDLVYGPDRISIYAWDSDGNLIDSDHSDYGKPIGQVFIQFVTLYGVPLFI